MALNDKLATFSARQFCDVYAGIREDECEAIFREITEQEDTIMLAQYIRDKGFQEGELKGWRACFIGTIINPSFLYIIA